MSDIVQNILDQIAKLSEEDRLELERELARAADAEWERELQQVRRIARERGIDQAAIDRAVEEHRYSR